MSQQQVSPDTVISLRMTVATAEYLLNLAAQRPFIEVHQIVPSIKSQVEQQLAQQQLPLAGDQQSAVAGDSDAYAGLNRATRRAAIKGR